MIVPLTLIQEDKMAELKLRKISACKLDICGSAQTLEDADSDSDEEGDETIPHTKVIQTSAKFDDVWLLSTHFGERLLSEESCVKKVNVIVVDECHTIDQWGESFREAFS